MHSKIPTFIERPSHLLDVYNLNHRRIPDAVQGHDRVALSAIPRTLSVFDGRRQDLIRSVAVRSARRALCQHRDEAPGDQTLTRGGLPAARPRKAVCGAEAFTLKGIVKRTLDEDPNAKEGG